MPVHPDNRYIYEFTAQNNWRYRLEILPRQQDNVTNHTTLTDYTITGDMGVFGEDMTLESGFDAHPLGLPKTPALKLKINLDALTGATEWTDLRACLLQPNLPASMYDSSGNALSETGEWTTPLMSVNYFNSANIFTLRSDLGDSGVTMSSATVIFQGGQRKTPTNKLELNHGDSFIEIDIFGIERIILEQLPLGMLDILIQPYVLHVNRFVIEQMVTQWAKTQIAPAGSIYCYAVQLSAFIENASLVATAMYRNLMRDNSADFTIAPLLGDINGSDKTIKMYKQTLGDADNPTGDAFTSESAIYFIYAVRDTSDTLYHCFSEKKFMGKYSNFYDMYKEIAEATFSKRVFFNTDVKTVQCYCVPIWDRTSSDTTQAITLSDIDIDTAKIELGGMSLRAARVNLYSVGSDETDKIEYFDSGTDSETDWDVPTAWHNMPQVTGLGFQDDGSYRNGDEYYGRASAEQGLFTYIYYGTNELARVHDYVELYDGAGTTFSSTIVTLNDTFSANNALIKGNFITRQQQSCLPYTLAKAILISFSGAGQSVLEYDALRPELLAFYMPFYIGNLWTTDVTPFKSYLSDVGTTGILIESKIEIVKSSVSVKFLIKGTY